MSFKYTPKEKYTDIDLLNSEIIVPELLYFKGGYKEIYIAHTIGAETLRKYLSVSKINYQLQEDLKISLKEVDRLLIYILRITDILRKEFAPEHLASYANKNSYSHFQSSIIGKNEIEYLKLVQVYELSKFHIPHIKEKWYAIKDIFESIDVTQKNLEILTHILKVSIYPILDTIELTLIYLARLAIILDVKTEKHDYNRLSITVKYHDFIQYAPNIVLSKDIDHLIQKISHATETKYHYTKNTNEYVNTTTEHIETKEIPESNLNSAFINSNLLDTRGSYDFNQRYLYVLTINQAKLEKEQLKIERSVYAETYVASDPKTFRQELIKRILYKMTEEERILEYNIFLTDYFETIYSSLTIHFNTDPPCRLELILYHFGPIFFLKCVLYCMRKAKTGYIHSYIDKQRMNRQLPFEYIKSRLMLWWDDNIFKNTTLADRNSLKIYNDITKFITKMWQNDQVAILTKISKSSQLQEVFFNHDIDALLPFLEFNLSYFFLLFFMRFLGLDFIYLPVHRNNFTKEPQETRIVKKVVTTK